MCAGDLSLEDAFVVDTASGQKGVATAGVGAHHKCANWDAIYDLAKTHSWRGVRANDNTSAHVVFAG